MPYIYFIKSYYYWHKPTVFCYQNKTYWLLSSSSSAVFGWQKLFCILFLIETEKKYEIKSIKKQLKLIHLKTIVSLGENNSWTTWARTTPLHSCNYLKKLSVQINVATEEGNIRNEMQHWTNDEIGEAVQSWLWVRVEPMVG